jgi:hypothetical protein
MLLAHVVLSAAVAAQAPSRSDVVRPCADVSAMCRISPFFCPSTYPQGLEPCWPDASRQTHQVTGGGRNGSVRTNPSGASQTKAAAPQNAPVSRPAPAKFSFQLER